MTDAVITHFRNSRPATGQFWRIVLAAGAGRRLTSITGGTPKQYWRAGGRSSLLEVTLDRLAPLGRPRHTILVVDRSHAPYLGGLRLPGGLVMQQPMDRGTAAGVLLGLTPVLAMDPDAVVMLTPSDHGVIDTGVFEQTILRTAGLVEHGAAGIVLFGVTPSSSCDQYGWIVPGAPCARLGPGYHRVKRFVERPSVHEVENLMAERGLWSTMVVVARASTLWRLFARHQPKLIETFSQYLRQPADDRAAWLGARYADMPPADFSKDVLEHASDLTVCPWPESIGWADLGTPERLLEWTSRAALPMVEVSHAVAAGL